MKFLFVGSIIILASVTEVFSFIDFLIDPMDQFANFGKELLEQWKTFKKMHKREFKSIEQELGSLKFFQENFKLMQSHNSNFGSGGATFKMAMNKFADMDHSEFVRTMNGYKSNRRNETQTKSTRKSYGDAPSSFDWRDKGAVTPVKNQGSCGSCWSFAAVAALEGAKFLKDGKLPDLSEQNLVDCSKEDNGCNGGLPASAFKYIKSNGGINSEKTYPYKGKDQQCKFNSRDISATVKSHDAPASGDEKALKSALANVGPIAIAIDASHKSFQLYESGVYYESKCSSDKLDHAVTLVGYGSEGGQNYWLVKNSWGEDWGEKGYIKMARNKNNNCGIATEATYPVV